MVPRVPVVPMVSMVPMVPMVPRVPMVPIVCCAVASSTLLLECASCPANHVPWRRMYGGLT